MRAITGYKSYQVIMYHADIVEANLKIDKQMQRDVRGIEILI